MKMSFAIIFGGGILVFLAVVLAVVFIPGLVWNPPQTIAAHSYTAAGNAWSGIVLVKWL